MRAGADALTMLSVPLNVHVLRALEEEPRPLVDLRRVVGSPPQTTMRGHLRALTELGVLERRRQSEFPGSVDYELGGPGRELLEVAEILQAWLADAPDGPLLLGSAAAKSVIKALADGWSSTMVRALAATPLSLTDLNKVISALNYPSLERRLVAMRLSGLIKPFPSEGRSTPYMVTDWMRRAIAPLTAAVRWERRYLRATSAPVARLDAEAGFLLSVPLLKLPPEESGSCRLAVEMRSENGDPRLGGVLIGVRNGEIVTCSSRLEGNAAAWSSGTTSAWLSALVDGDFDRLEIGGDCSLAMALLDGLHHVLFRAKLRN